MFIDGSLYGRVLNYPSIDVVFLWHIDRTYVGAVLRRIIFEKKKLKIVIGEFSKNGDFGDLI